MPKQEKIMKQISLGEILKELTEKEIGGEIYDMRRLKRKTQIQMAKALGISTTQVQNYEHGVNRVSVSRLKEIANFLEIDILELLPKSIKEN